MVIVSKISGRAERLAAVLQEMAFTNLKHGPILSIHAGHSILLEEMDEFWDEVKKQPDERDTAKMRNELIQVAAVALRIIEFIEKREVK